MKHETTTVCTRCVMDTTDSGIVFDENGVCSHCLNFDQKTKPTWFPNDVGKQKLDRILENIRAEGKGKEYDCIIGLSGGVDSSYLALVMKDWGLRPLVVHVDAGWNSELAVFNIEQIVKYCGFELYTHVMDWQEVRDLQISYLKAGVANQDVVQDHAFFASLYHFAVKNGIRYVISGGNIATESIFPKSWHHSAMDAINLHSIHKKHGSRPLKHYKTISFLEYFFYYPFIKKMTAVRPLNYMPYNKNEAIKELKSRVGYKEYGRKHGESRFTKYFQNHYLPTKFGYDKRKPHLSSIILAGGMTRSEALEELKKPLYETGELLQDQEYIAKKLGLPLEEFQEYVRAPGKNYDSYNNWDKSYQTIRFIRSLIEKLLKRNVKNYA